MVAVLAALWTRLLVALSGGRVTPTWREVSPTAGAPASSPADLRVEVPTIGVLILAGAAVSETAAFVAPWTYRSLAEDIAPGGMIDAALLQALATHESNNNPQAIGAENPNGTRDYGLFQINSANFARYGLTAGNVFDPEVNGRAAVAELERRLPNAHNVADLVSMYNAGEEPGGGPRKNADGTYINQAYVRAVTGWYLVYRVAEFAPIKRAGVPA